MRSLHLCPLALLLVVSSVASAAESFDSGSDSSDQYMQSGDTFSFTFNEVNEGGIHYHCHPHPWMTGMVHVFEEGALGRQEPGTNTHYVDIVEGNTSDDWGYAPEHLNIEVGDTVVWTNTGAIPHTVSSDSAEHEHEDEPHDHDEHDEGHPDDDTNGTPTPSLLLVLVALGAIATLRRRP